MAESYGLALVLGLLIERNGGSVRFTESELQRFRSKRLTLCSPMLDVRTNELVVELYKDTDRDETGMRTT